MKDEQLLQMGKKKAEEKLAPDDLERYNELKEKELQDGLDEKKAEDAKKDSEALENLVDSSRNSLRKTVDINGSKIEIKADPGTKTVSKLQKLYNRKDENLESLTDNEMEEIYSDVLDILADVCVDYDRNDWDNALPDPEESIATPLVVVGEVYKEVEKVLNQKKSR